MRFGFYQSEIWFKSERTQASRSLWCALIYGCSEIRAPSSFFTGGVPSHSGKVQALAEAETLLTGSPACFFALPEVYPDLQANANMNQLTIMASPAKIVRRRR
jgi:hypothetical protein